MPVHKAHNERLSAEMRLAIAVSMGTQSIECRIREQACGDSEVHIQLTGNTCIRARGTVPVWREQKGGPNAAVPVAAWFTVCSGAVPCGFRAGSFPVPKHTEYKVQYSLRPGRW